MKILEKLDEIPIEIGNDKWYNLIQWIAERNKSWEEL